jgi:hypothetical protein
LRSLCARLTFRGFLPLFIAIAPSALFFDAILTDEC